MSLRQYEVDFSALSSDKRTALINRIEDFSFNGLQWNDNFQTATFLIEKTLDVNALNIPSVCRLKRLL